MEFPQEWIELEPQRQGDEAFPLFGCDGPLGRLPDQVFLDEFVNPSGPYELVGYWPRPDDADPTHIHGEIRLAIGEKSHTVTADGNGPISAFVHGMKQLVNIEFRVKDYHEQAVGKGADARAVAYVPLELPGGQTLFGVGSDTNIDQAAVRAIVAALNRWATSGKTR